MQHRIHALDLLENRVLHPPPPVDRAHRRPASSAASEMIASGFLKSCTVDRASRSTVVGRSACRLSSRLRRLNACRRPEKSRIRSSAGSGCWCSRRSSSSRPRKIVPVANPAVAVAERGRHPHRHLTKNVPDPIVASTREPPSPSPPSICPRPGSTREDPSPGSPAEKLPRPLENSAAVPQRSEHVVHPAVRG